MYRLTDLRCLAESYIAATGISANLLSNRISGRSNNRMIGRLLEGYGVSAPSIEAASDFFDEHWPDDVAWPEGVVRANGKDAAE